MKKEIYFSVDVETDGPIPGPHSMLSLGCAAFSPEGELLGTFSANLETLEGASGHPDTMAWWGTQTEAWEAHRKDIEDPKNAVCRFVRWVKDFNCVPVFVAYPAGFDFTWTYWYMIRFAGESPFSFSALDMKSYASAILKLPYRETKKKNFPKEWFGEDQHSHVAVEDAKEQGEIFIRMLKANQPKSLFETKVQEFILDTAEDDWDGEGGKPVPKEQVELLYKQYRRVKEALPYLPDPYPSVSGDGSVYLRWSYQNNLFDAEFPPSNGHDGFWFCRRVGTNHNKTGRVVGKISSTEELIDQLRFTFGS